MAARRSEESESGVSGSESIIGSKPWTAPGDKPEEWGKWEVGGPASVSDFAPSSTGPEAPPEADLRGVPPKMMIGGEAVMGDVDEKFPSVWAPGAS